MFQESEIINLALGLIGLIVLARFVERKRMEQFSLFLMGYLALLGAYVATLVEGVIAHDLFNLLEHALMALSGILFAMGVWRLGKTPTSSPRREQTR